MSNKVLNKVMQNEIFEIIMNDIEFLNDAIEETQKNLNLKMKSNKVPKNDIKLSKFWNYFIFKGKNGNNITIMPCVNFFVSMIM